MLPNVCSNGVHLVHTFIMSYFVALLPVEDICRAPNGSYLPVSFLLKTSCNPRDYWVGPIGPDISHSPPSSTYSSTLLYIVKGLSLEILMMCILNWILFSLASIAMLFNLVKGMFVSESMCIYHKFSIEYFSTFSMFLLHSYIKYFVSRCENSLYINAAETL